MPFVPQQQRKQLAATRISTLNGQQLTSTGVNALDDVFGGGLPLGTVCLLKHDRMTGYAGLLLKYFAAQGIASDHLLYFATAEGSPQDWIESLMAPIDTSTEVPVTSSTSARAMGQLRDRMNIAWRYQSQPRLSNALVSGSIAPDSVYCRTFDITKRIEVQKKDRIYLDDGESLGDDYLDTMLARVKQLLEKATRDSAVLRICIESIASSAWKQLPTIDQLCRFIVRLRAMVRNTNAVCVVSLRDYLLTNGCLARIDHCADAVLSLESFASLNMDSSIAADFHGFIRPSRVYSTNSNVSHTRVNQVDRHSLAFKVRRKRFAIQVFTLPPTADSQSTNTKNIDF